MTFTLNRIFALLASVFVLLLSVVAFSSWQVRQHGEAADAATLRRYQSYLLADELRQSSDDLTRLARTYVVSGDAKWEQQYFEVLDIRNGKKARPAHYEGIYWDFRAAGIEPPQTAGKAVALTDLMKNEGFTEAEFGKLNEAKANSDDLVRTETIAMNMVKGLYDDGKGGFTRKADPDPAKAQAMMHDLAYHQYKAKIMKPVQEFLDALDQRTRSEVVAAQSARALWGSIALGALALMCAAMIAALYWARGMIYSLFADVRKAVAAIESGDLTERTTTVYGDDPVGQAMRSVQSMRGALERIIVQIRGNANSIATGSMQIATGNADLSHRTEEQASNLQQTAASMEEISGTVKANADTASHANELASTASTAAVKGGALVGEVVSTMQEIAESSRRIADIIGVIDGIAFQTNILALNAAVEAARAGDQGRGFAVVASEVRSLAGRSAEAAKEIRTLIGASVAKVDIGARQVNEAGASMEEIVSQVQRVSQLIGEISGATHEQSSGIGQVGDAVTQMDQMTQQNAALVEENAAAAESLKQQAAQLAELVSVFKVSGHAGEDSAARHDAMKPTFSNSLPPTRPATPAARPAQKEARSTVAGAPVSAPAPRASVAATAGDDWETF